MVQAIEESLSVTNNFEEADYITFHQTELNYNPDQCNITLNKFYELKFELDQWTGNNEAFVVNDLGSTCLINMMFETTLYKKNS